MLHHAPQAVILVESLAVLAACTIDVSLVSDDYPALKFKRLTCPGSFKASLYEVSTHICNAFRTADSSMNKIKMALIDMPNYFDNALDAATNASAFFLLHLKKLSPQTMFKMLQFLLYFSVFDRFSLMTQRLNAP